MAQIVTLKQLIGYAIAMAIAIVVTFALPACSPAPTGLTQLHDYQQRIANTLSREPIAYTPKFPPQIPASRDLRLSIPRLQISLLDSIRLDACPAGALIAERNSALGRLREGVLRYYHDRQLLMALKDCASQLEHIEPELSERVREQANAKQAVMPLLRMQAIIADDSIRASLRPADRALPVVDGAQLAPVLQAFNVVLTAINNNAELPSQKQLEQALEIVDKSPYIGQLWRSLNDHRFYLLQLQPLVSTLSADAGCLSKGVPERARILRQIFIARFSGPVQQHISGLTRQAQQIEAFFPSLRATPELIVEQPNLKAWNDYLRHIAALDDQLIAETRNHVEYWQQFFADCEFSPGA